MTEKAQQTHDGEKPFNRKPKQFKPGESADIRQVQVFPECVNCSRGAGLIPHKLCAC